MMISISHRFAFLAVPKCASIAIERALAPHCQIHTRSDPRVRHTTFRDFDQYLRPYLGALHPQVQFETVSVMREPLSWLHSWYRFRSRDAIQDPAHREFRTSTRAVSYAEFIEDFLAEQPPPHARFGPRSQLHFIQDAGGQVGVDRVFAYERIDGLLEYFASRIGKPLVLEQRNVSPAIATAPLPAALEERLRATLAPDLAYYAQLRERAALPA